MAEPLSQVHAADYLNPQTLAAIAPLELRARMIIEGVMSGMHRSPYQGMAVEFAAHRPYVPGDDLRHLDWKVFARTDRLHLRQYQQETNLDVMIMIDRSASMGFGTAPTKKQSASWTKFDHAVALTAALAHLALHQHDRVGVATFTDRICKLAPISGARGHWNRIVELLSGVTVNEATNLPRAVDELLSTIQHRSLFVLISDFFIETVGLRRSLARLRHRGHDVILLNTLDRQEMQFQYVRPATFEGLEGEGRLRADPRALREGYLRALRSHLHWIEAEALRRGMDYCRLDTHESVGPPLAWLLARRQSKTRRSTIG